MIYLWGQGKEFKAQNYLDFGIFCSFLKSLGYKCCPNHTWY